MSETADQTAQDSFEIQNSTTRVQSCSLPCVRSHVCIFDEAIRHRAAVRRLLTLFYIFAPGDSKVSVMMAL